MATESFIVTAADGTTDTTYSLAFRSGFRSLWSVSGVAIASAKQLEFNHDVKPGVGEGNDKHSIIIRHNLLNTANDAITQSTIKLELSLNRDAVWNSTKVMDLVSHLKSLLLPTVVNSLRDSVTMSGDYNVTGPFNPISV